MKNTSAELLLELQSQKTHLTNCILTVLPKELTAGFCANIIQSGIFLPWSSCRQAQSGGEEARGVTAVTFPSLPITITLPLVTASTLNFLAIDYTGGNVSKAFHCWVRALSLLQQKKKAIKFPEGRWGWGYRAPGPKRSPWLKACNRRSLEAPMQSYNDVPLASINSLPS